MAELATSRFSLEKNCAKKSESALPLVLVLRRVICTALMAAALLLAVNCIAPVCGLTPHIPGTNSLDGEKENSPFGSLAEIMAMAACLPASMPEGVKLKSRTAPSEAASAVSCERWCVQ
jgi:hypothetical protein